MYWNPPQIPNGVVTGYTLYIGHENGAVEVFSTDEQTTSYNVTNLFPYELISVKVTASTRIGEGPAAISEIRTAQTRMCNYRIQECMCYDWCFFSLAPQKVTQLVVRVISDNSVSVQWSPPVRANGILTYYSVLVFNKRAGYNSSSQVDANDDGEVTIHGLSALHKKNSYALWLYLCR